MYAVFYDFINSFRDKGSPGYPRTCYIYEVGVALTKACYVFFFFN